VILLAARIWLHIEFKRRDSPQFRGTDNAVQLKTQCIYRSGRCLSSLENKHRNRGLKNLSRVMEAWVRPRLAILQLNHKATSVEVRGNLERINLGGIV
jgi:hypothetical protein